MAFNIGWASCSITPEQPVFVSGQFNSRVSTGVMDPVTATALALESDESDAGGVILVSCDLVCIPDAFRAALRENASRLVPEVKPENIIFNATHTHTAPELRGESESPFAPSSTGASAMDNGVGNVPQLKEIERDVMYPAEYVRWVVPRISEAIAEAWRSRKPGGIGFGLGQAVVGHNRRVSYYNGESRMYGDTSVPDFSHIEGYEDHGVNILCTWDTQRRLTGVVLNIACPSQDSESLSVLSADYWHDVRTELRTRLGEDLFVLAQISAAGDQSPHLMLGKAAEQRMWRLMGRTHRQDLAARIADSVTAVLPYIESETDWNPVFRHTVETLDLPCRMLTEEDLETTSADAADLRKAYEELLADYGANPETREPLEWYTLITANYRRMRWNEAVAQRYARQQDRPTLPYEVHALRLGDIAIATNPFEYFLDFGTQIKARSRAIQTFVVQLAGGGTYLPTQRAISGRSYGATAPSTPIGPEGGRKLAEWSIDAVNAFFSEPV